MRVGAAGCEPECERDVSYPRFGSHSDYRTVYADTVISVRATQTRRHTKRASGGRVASDGILPAALSLNCICRVRL